ISFQQAPGAGKSSGLYGLYATGKVEIVGLGGGLNVSGTVTFEVNTTTSGFTMPNPVSGATPASIQIPASTFSLVVSNADLSVPGIFDLSGTTGITRSADGTLTLAIAGASVSLSINGTQVFSIGGSATFTIDPVNGFQMQTFSVGNFSIFGGIGIPT